ncbi:hypothetical protein PC128_g17909 [Phytophthora cactorum]|nr:hypothetical protein PC128_g17909 [Phytophthora cactorum]
MFGGSNADIKNHPYVAELLAKSIDDEPFCGGTLIAPQYVLTAVSCLAWLPFDMHVPLGGQKNKGRSSRKAEQIRVVETYRHPVFNSTWLPYDVALLKLKKPSTHKPARLCDADGSDNKPGTMASVFGWGDVSEKGTAETFQSVDVKIISDDECGKYARNTDFTFCTAGKGFCDGDTGGPLIANGVVVGTCIASMFPGDAGDCGIDIRCTRACPTCLTTSPIL